MAVAVLLATGPQPDLRPTEPATDRITAQPTRASAVQSTLVQHDLSSVTLLGAEGEPQGLPKPVHGELADPALARVVDDVVAGRPVEGDVARVRAGRIRVEVVSDGRAPLAAIRAVGGQVVGAVGGLILADVPATELAGLEARPDVAYVRFPQSVGLPEPGDDGEPPAPSTAAARGTRGGEAVTKTGVDRWHAAGKTGQGVKVGIIDSFSLATWNGAIAAGELAGPPAGGFCQRHGVGCAATFWDGGNHGVGVAEVINDLAPGATIYVASASTAVDLKAVVDYFASQGVRIITRSLTGVYDGPGNGEGPVADVVAYAESRGIAWFNSAGNAGGGPGYQGSYFRSGWVDTDGDGWMNFPGGSPYLAFNCYFISGLRWNDWGTNRTDYDLYVYDEMGAAPTASSLLDQQAGALPLETFQDGGGCSGSDEDYIAIKRFAVGNGSAGDVLEFMVNGSGVASWSNRFSVTQPAGDVATPGAAVIGAIDPVNGTTIAPYSSQGPTNDGRIKPDLSAASNFTSFSGPGGRFNGTSAATPVAAGAAAVLLGAHPQWTPAQLVGVMRGQVVDRGVPGPDPVYGTGELHLAPPPAAHTPPGSVRRLAVHGPAWSHKRRITWVQPSATGGLPILKYSVRVYIGRKRVAHGVLPGSRHAVKLRTSGLRTGKYRVYVAAYNAAGWGPWALDTFRIRRR